MNKTKQDNFFENYTPEKCVHQIDHFDLNCTEKCSQATDIMIKIARENPVL